MPTFSLPDNALAVAAALPDGAASASTAAVDTGARTQWGAGLEDAEVLVTAPALDASALPDGKAMTYAVECDDDPDFASPRTVADAVIVQTGAGGAGAAGATARVRLPTDCERYVRCTATGSAAGDASAASMAMQMLF